MVRLLREPLIYFLAVGIAAFLLPGFMSEDPRTLIEVTEAREASLADQWRSQMGRDPTAAELQGLVDQWIREEIYYREGLAMGLDENDVIIRRRLAQKLTFLTQDLAVAGTPEPQALKAYYQTHAGRYAIPERFTFSQRYFAGAPGQQAPEAARRALQRIAAGGSPPEGDPFMLPQRYARRSREQIDALFGTGFAAAVAELPAGEWQGPVPSEYGWHLVKLERRDPARQLAFEEAAQRVALDYEQARRQQANDTFYESLRARYEIRRR